MVQENIFSNLKKDKIMKSKLNLTLKAKYSEALRAHIISISFKISKSKIYWLQ